MKKFAFLMCFILLTCYCAFSLSACGTTDDADKSGEIIINSLRYAPCKDGTYSVLGFTPEADQTSAIIEKQINKKPVTVIKEKAFLNCAELKNLTIPEGLKVIEDMAFNGCTSLSDVFIPEGVISIGEAAFSTTVKNISVPDSIEKADYFIDTANALYASNTIYNELNGDKYLGNANNPYVVLCRVGENVTNYSVNEKTKIIGYSAFFKGYDTALVSVNIPNGVKSIGSAAFQACDKLANINFPDGIKYIGSKAFENCFSLTNVTLPNSIKSIGREAFSSCVGLKSIKLPDGLTTIDHFTFNDCNKLTNITIPANVTVIGSFAFRNCHALTSITIPNGVTTISPRTFSNCTSLTNVTIPDSVTVIEIGAFSNCTSLTSITIPSNVATIGNAAFSGCYNVEKAEVSPANKNYYSKNNCIIEKSTKTLKFACKNGVIPENGEIVKISDSAFGACDESCFNSFNNALYFKSENNEFFALVKVSDESIASCEINAKTQIIADSAFHNCENLTSVTIPSSVTKIGDSTFKDCKNLTSVTIPSSVTQMGDSMFENCYSLQKVVLPDTITKIGDSTFKDCHDLKDLTIGENVRYIGDEAFYACRALKSVHIPKSVTHIGRSAFACIALENITFGGTIEEWNAIEKLDDWNEFVITKKVICTDGSMNL